MIKTLAGGMDSANTVAITPHICPNLVCQNTLRVRSSIAEQTDKCSVLDHTSSSYEAPTVYTV